MATLPVLTGTAPTDEEKQSLTDFLTVLTQDENGIDVFDNNKALVGFLEAKFNLMIPKAFDDRHNDDNAIKIDLKVMGEENGNQHLIGTGKLTTGHKANYPYITGRYANADEKNLDAFRIACLNFASLREAGMNEIPAFVAATLRSRWCMTGAYGVAKADKSTLHSEITVVEPGDGIYAPIADAATINEVLGAMGQYAVDFMAHYKNEAHGWKWCVRHAENLWAAVEHAFRVRAHHFKDSKKEVDSYKDLYTRHLEASYEGDFSWPDGVSMFEIFHTAIHPFKIKALPVMVGHYTVYLKISNAAITRLSGAPCGNAIITTTVAALDTMRSEAWWNAFVMAYGDNIEEAVALAKQINSNKYGYHQAANLYGVEKKVDVLYNRKSITMDEAKSRVSNIASAAQGMIGALKKAKDAKLITKFALQNAKALEKPAGGNPLLALRIGVLVEQAIGAISDADTLETAIASALPDLKRTYGEASTEIVTTGG